MTGLGAAGIGILGAAAYLEEKGPRTGGPTPISSPPAGVRPEESSMPSYMHRIRRGETYAATLSLRIRNELDFMDILLNTHALAEWFQFLPIQSAQRHLQTIVFAPTTDQLPYPAPDPLKPTVHVLRIVEELIERVSWHAVVTENPYAFHGVFREKLNEAFLKHLLFSDAALADVSQRGAQERQLREGLMRALARQGVDGLPVQFASIDLSGLARRYESRLSPGDRVQLPQLSERELTPKSVLLEDRTDPVGDRSHLANE